MEEKLLVLMKPSFFMGRKKATAKKSLTTFEMETFFLLRIMTNSTPRTIHAAETDAIFDSDKFFK